MHSKHVPVSKQLDSFVSGYRRQAIAFLVEHYVVYVLMISEHLGETHVRSALAIVKLCK